MDPPRERLSYPWRVNPAFALPALPGPFPSASLPPLDFSDLGRVVMTEAERRAAKVAFSKTDFVEPDPAMAEADLTAARPEARVMFSQVANAPRERVLEALRTWPPERWSTFSSVDVAFCLARFGDAALAPLRALAEHQPDFSPLGLANVEARWAVRALGRGFVGDADVELQGLQVLVRHGALARDTLAWLTLMGDDATRPRAAAWLRRWPGEREALRAWAEAHDVVEALNAALSPAWEDPAVDTAKRIPKALVAVTPPVLRDGSTLSKEEASNLLFMLAAPLGPHHPALRRALAALDAKSAAAYGEALLATWTEAGGATMANWVVQAYATLGGASAARNLGVVGRQWSAAKAGHERRWARLAVAALLAVQRPWNDAATDLDSPESAAVLRALGNLSERAKDDAASTRAQAALGIIALVHGLGPEAISDRLLPDLGLGQDGTMTLDFGPRRFSARFTDELTLVLQDETGKPLADLPKPGKKDDAARAEEAVRRWRELRADAKSLLAIVLLRLEHAMTEERRWSKADFERLVLDKPFMLVVARRLLWGAFNGDGSLTAFRIAEDRSLADIEDAHFVVPDGARVGLAHPLHLEAQAVLRWRERFEDYLLIQPFEQLARRSFVLPRDRDASTHWSLHPGAVMGVVRDANAAWREERQAFHVDALRCSARAGALLVRLSPGVDPRDAAGSGRQSLSAVEVSGNVSPVEASDALYRLWCLAGRPAS